MNKQPEGEPDYIRVIARSLAFLCLEGAGLSDEEVTEKGQFLVQLGLPVREAADMIGSSEESLKKLLGRRKKGRGRGRKPKAKAKAGS